MGKFSEVSFDKLKSLRFGDIKRLRHDKFKGVSFRQEMTATRQVLKDEVVTCLGDCDKTSLKKLSSDKKYAKEENYGDYERQKKWTLLLFYFETYGEKKEITEISEEAKRYTGVFVDVRQEGKLQRLWVAEEVVIIVIVFQDKRERERELMLITVEARSRHYCYWRWKEENYVNYGQGKKKWIAGADWHTVAMKGNS